MMNYLRGAQPPYEASPYKNEAAEPVVKEVIPSPAATEKEDPLTYSQKRASAPPSPPADALTVTKILHARPSLVSNSRTVSGRFVTTYLQEQHTVIKDRSRAKLGAGISGHVFDTSYHGLLEWISKERLSRLPHKGSAWDRVLSAAHYFAEQVNGKLHSNRASYFESLWRLIRSQRRIPHPVP